MDVRSFYVHIGVFNAFKERELGPNCATWKNAAFVEISDDVKKEIIDAHNEYRSNVALGSESRGNRGPQPKAANMNFVVKHY